MNDLHYGNWHAGIGDPSIIGWVTFFAYFLTAGLAGYICYYAPDLFSGHHKRIRCLWGGVFLLFLFLGFNKQLDLQSLLTEIGRTIAHNQGWFDLRREVQKWFVLALGILGIIVMVIFFALISKVIRENWFLLVGIILLMTFVMMRAALFHHVDRFHNVLFLGRRMNWVLELAGISFVFIQAIIILRYRKDRMEEGI